MSAILGGVRSEIGAQPPEGCETRFRTPTKVAGTVKPTLIDIVVTDPSGVWRLFAQVLASGTPFASICARGNDVKEGARL